MRVGETVAALSLRGATGHTFLFVVIVLLQRDVRWYSVVVTALDVIGWMLLTPLLSKWLDTGLIPFVLTPVLSHLLILVFVFDLQVGGMENVWLIDSGCL